MPSACMDRSSSSPAAICSHLVVIVNYTKLALPGGWV